VRVTELVVSGLSIATLLLLRARLPGVVATYLGLACAVLLGHAVGVLHSALACLLAVSRPSPWGYRAAHGVVVAAWFVLPASELCWVHTATPDLPVEAARALADCAIVVSRALPRPIIVVLPTLVWCCSWP
jgi:predicted trehalose synthase